MKMKCTMPHTVEKNGVTIKTFEAGKTYKAKEADLGEAEYFEPVREAESKPVKAKKSTTEVKDDDH